MTLIVYKNGVLAADTRASISCSHHDRTTCAHCNGETTSVDDKISKISLPRVRGTRIITFRDEKVLAVAGAGSSDLVESLKKLLLQGENIETAFHNYLSIHGRLKENPTTCTLVLICETNNYTVRVPKKGGMLVTSFNKDEIINIGSGAPAAEWINNFVPHLTAAHIVNLAMFKNITVGGEIDYVDFSKPERSVERFTKIEPESMLTALVDTFKQGMDAKRADTKKRPRKPPIKKP